jgi:hypothetical protein
MLLYMQTAGPSAAFAFANFAQDDSAFAARKITLFKHEMRDVILNS